MDAVVGFSLKFDGNSADSHQIDLYDASHALIGLQRSLALTTHLLLNGEIITQAPSLKGARVYATVPEEGSWKVTAIILTGIYTVGTAPVDTPLGHLLHSAYDYVISESLGVHVDYDKSLGQLIEEEKASEAGSLDLKQHQFDSLIEKCSTAITQMHRPIVKTASATSASIQSIVGHRHREIGPPISHSTYLYIHEEISSERPMVFEGRVSSYNSNTYKGRIYVVAEGRPVAFELSDRCRSNPVVKLIVSSLSANAVGDVHDESCVVYFRAFSITSRSGQLKRYLIIDVSHSPIREDGT